MWSLNLEVNIRRQAQSKNDACIQRNYPARDETKEKRIEGCKQKEWIMEVGKEEPVVEA